MVKVTLAQLPALISAYKHRLDAVVKQSAHDVAAEAQKPRAQGGRLPVDTGYLRNSFASSLAGSTSLTGPDSYVMIAGAMKAGDVAHFGWTAEYAPHVNYGARGRSGAHFVEGAVDQWQAIVRRNVARARQEIGL